MKTPRFGKSFETSYRLLKSRVFEKNSLSCCGLYWDSLGRISQSILSRAHSMPSKQRTAIWFGHLWLSYGWSVRAVQNVISDAQNSILLQVETIGKLNEVASKFPYYKYNGLWTRDIQNAVRETRSLRSRIILKWDTQVFAIILCGWLGGFHDAGVRTESGRLLSIEEVGEILHGQFWESLMLVWSPLRYLKSSGQPQGPRCFSLDYRRVPPVSDYPHRWIGMVWTSIYWEHFLLRN